MIFTSILLFGACKKDDVKKAGEPFINSKTDFEKAHFGDSLSFTIDVKDDEVPLSTLKAQLFFSEEMVSETVIRTKTNGEYTGKLYIPYLPNIPNGTATVKLILQNINLTITEMSYDLPLERPDYPFLTLVTETKEYRMERTALYEYALSDQLPAKVNGYIKAPAVGTQGNELTFGWENNEITQGVTGNIPFSNSSSGNYDITFNTFDYEAAPFIIAYAINEKVMERLDDNHFRLDLALSKGEELTIDGIEDLESWWLDADFIRKDDDGKLSFVPQDGNYRITADFKLKYFIFEVLQGGSLATLQPDGTGAVWIIGDGIGKPSLSANTVGWDTGKALCLAPVGDKKYQITVVAGTTMNANDINFKFFHQKDWGGEFTNNVLSTTSDIIFIGDGANGRDSGNLGIVAGKSFESGVTYLFTLDLSKGNDKAVLTVDKN